MTVVSGNIRFVPIFEGVLGERASNDSGVIANMDFHGFRRYTSSAALEIRPKLLYSNIYSFVACPLTAKYLTFNDSEWLEYQFT